MEGKGFVTKSWLWLLYGDSAERHNMGLTWQQMLLDV